MPSLVKLTFNSIYRTVAETLTNGVFKRQKNRKKTHRRFKTVIELRNQYAVSLKH